MLRAVWRVAGPLYRVPGRLAAYVNRLSKESRCVTGEDVVLHPSCQIANNRDREAISIDAHSRICARLQTFGHGGRIAIGRHCFIGEGTYIWSAVSITIGDRVLISHGVNIHDCISHSLSARERHDHFLKIFSVGHPKELPNVDALPVCIGDDVWIGFGATVLKGVTIGRGAVVGAQSLVTKDVPEYTVVAGSPARVIGRSAP